MLNRPFLPPGPTAWPIIGSIPAMRRQGMLAFFTHLAEEYGPVARFRAFNEDCWLVSDPDLIQQVLVRDAASFAKGRGLERARSFLGESLLTSEGAAHRRQRRLVQPAFHHARLRSYSEVMRNCAVEWRDRWAEKWESGQTLNLSEEMATLTMRIVTRTLFGTKEDPNAEAVGPALATLVDNFNLLLLPGSSTLQRLPLPRLRRIREAQASIDRTVSDIISARRQSGIDAGDLLSELIFAEDADQPGARLSEREVRDQVLTLFLAGHETTANALTWTWWLLHAHPAVRRTLQAELGRTLGGRSATMADFASLPYTTAVIKESLRLYPPAWTIGRRCLRPVTLGPYLVPSGTLVISSQWVMHRSARHFPSPLAFDPGRWLEPATDDLPKFAYFPFGGGARSCIGEHFAHAEMVIILATLAQHWLPRPLDPDAIPRPLPRITLRPEGGIPVQIVKTERPSPRHCQSSSGPVNVGG